MLSSTLVPIISEGRFSLLELLVYDIVKFYGTDGSCRIVSIKIPKKRKQLFDQHGLKNCFIDNTKIFDPCYLCRKTIPENKCHRFRTIRGISCHIISPEHKLTDSIDDILKALRKVERKSIFDQLTRKEIHDGF